VKESAKRGQRQDPENIGQHSPKDSVDCNKNEGNLCNAQKKNRARGEWWEHGRTLQGNIRVEE